MELRMSYSNCTNEIEAKRASLFIMLFAALFISSAILFSYHSHNVASISTIETVTPAVSYEAVEVATWKSDTGWTVGWNN